MVKVHFLVTNHFLKAYVFVFFSCGCLIFVGELINDLVISLIFVL
jgi:hypothetical protein